MNGGTRLLQTLGGAGAALGELTSPHASQATGASVFPGGIEKPGLNIHEGGGSQDLQQPAFLIPSVRGIERPRHNRGMSNQELPSPNREERCCLECGEALAPHQRRDTKRHRLCRFKASRERRKAEGKR